MVQCKKQAKFYINKQGSEVLDVTIYCMLDEGHKGLHTPSESVRDEIFLRVVSPEEGTRTDFNRSEWVFIF